MFLPSKGKKMEKPSHSWFLDHVMYNLSYHHSPHFGDH
jgi:hypothetical protein